MISIPESTLSILVPSLFNPVFFPGTQHFAPGYIHPPHLFMTQFNVSTSEKTSTFQAHKVTISPVLQMLFINNSTLTFTKMNSNYLLWHLSH